MRSRNAILPVFFLILNCIQSLSFQGISSENSLNPLPLYLYHIVELSSQSFGQILQMLALMLFGRLLGQIFVTFSVFSVLFQLLRHEVIEVH